MKNPRNLSETTAETDADWAVVVAPPPRSRSPRPTVVRPEGEPAGGPEPEGDRRIPYWVQGLVKATESRFSVPGTSLTFGYDALIGLIPGVGDFFGMLVGMSIVYAAHRAEASKGVLARMFGNLALDAALGSIPLVGNVFDFFFKANTRNWQILERHLKDRPECEAADP